MNKTKKMLQYNPLISTLANCKLYFEAGKKEVLKDIYPKVLNICLRIEKDLHKVTEELKVQLGDKK